MDPRQRRTRTKLRSTVLRLAAEKPIAQVTVAEIARDACVTRDTVYRHGADPVTLLADFLGDDLDALMAKLVGLPAVAPPGRTVFDHSEQELLEHILEHENIYRNALEPRLIGPLRDMLIDRISEGLAQHIAAHPEIAPSRDPRVSPETHGRMMVAYAAAGTVAAIEEWLRSGDLRSPEAAARTLIAASPEWWLGRTS